MAKDLPSDEALRAYAERRQAFLNERSSQAFRARLATLSVEEQERAWAERDAMFKAMERERERQLARNEKRATDWKLKPGRRP